MSEKKSQTTADLDDQDTVLDERLRAYYEQLQETPQYQTVKRAADNVATYIEKNPIQSALIALGAGVLIGLLLNRRND
ncbi:MAG: hypothetical protein HY22_10490 [[Candidatus Thermochlorobacteriaceae] bacterium GBChlB]|jgi:ElaB/YqjD/DUF883 family membrane-anchored ribosome-binding protein|nr:MAG: hypothetical protein HY22_10490 [[Candidatus Thermochlorobacteriaceae] bacterium GBChlB]